MTKVWMAMRFVKALCKKGVEVGFRLDWEGNETRKG